MTTTDVLAIIGAVTGIIGTIAGLFALCWDYYKWKYAERVQLKVTAIPNFVNAEDRRKEMIWVSVTNIGKIPTTIKLLTLHGFNSKRGMKKRNGENLAIITQPFYGQLPAKLNPGDDWDGGFDQHSEGIEEYLKYKYFVVQVEDTMSNKPFRAEVDKSLVKKLSS
ncbi:MAG: hypothetical protein H0W76_26295 [Pyrinomonadaceae bacterium]|nr:hypothetical protein [Pyrinomonadaceae bacterium]